jgi:signal transduction histidine kinase
VAAGTGIGLTVSRRIARMMDGDVTLDDRSEPRTDHEPLGGAVFTLWLPAADDGKD